MDTKADTYQPTRPVMTAAELQAHRVDQYGRDYSESDNGYDDIEAESKRGWHAVSAWGRDGWDLGEWPYVVLSVRNSTALHSTMNVGAPGIEVPEYELLSTCEGDRTVYRFESAADREAAIDYLFQWYAAGREWSVATWETRDQLDAGALEVPTMWRGPFSWERCA